MSAKEEESSSEDDDFYVPSDPEEDDDEEEPEDAASSSDDEVAGSGARVTASRKQTESKNDGPEETEEERQKRLESLFAEFIDESGDQKSSSDQALQESSGAGEAAVTSTTGNKVPKLTADTTDDIFAGVSDSTHIPAKSVDESQGKEKKVWKPGQGEKRKSSDGLTNAISSLTKKSKMSVLEKTAQEWGAYKEEQGIQEELKSHNRGKHGYVDRVEFLTRADYRQFEKERDARNAARKKK